MFTRLAAHIYHFTRSFLRQLGVLLLLLPLMALLLLLLMLLPDGRFSRLLLLLLQDRIATWARPFHPSAVVVASVVDVVDVDAAGRWNQAVMTSAILY